MIVPGCGECFLHSVVRWWTKKVRGQSVIVPGCRSVLSSLGSPVMDEERTRSVGDCTWLWSVLSSLGSPVMDEERTSSVGDFA